MRDLREAQRIGSGSSWTISSALVRRGSRQWSPTVDLARELSRSSRREVADGQRPRTRAFEVIETERRFCCSEGSQIAVGVEDASVRAPHIAAFVARRPTSTCHGDRPKVSRPPLMRTLHLMPPHTLASLVRAITMRPSNFVVVSVAQGANIGSQIDGGKRKIAAHRFA